MTPRFLHRSWIPCYLALIASIATVVAALFASTAHAQFIGRALELDDLGFTNPLAVSARAAGMGGTYLAHGNDVHALMYNPAGLARIKRIELSLGIQHERNEVSQEFYGTPSSVDSRDGGLELLSAAYPLPVYRGSMVLAFGVYRSYSANFDLHYSGVNTTEGTLDNFLLQQTGSVYTYNLGFGVDLSTSASGGLSIFLVDGTINSLRQFDFTFLNPFSIVSVFISDDVVLDLDGVGARVGGQLHVHPRFSAGFVFNTPTWIKAKGTGSTERIQIVDNNLDEFRSSTAPVEAEYLLPYQMGVGLSGYPLQTLLVSVEIMYTDWSEAAVDRKRFRDFNLQPVFREVIDYRVGAEWTLPWLPMRARAGYAYRPFPMQFIQADRIENDLMSASTTKKERSEITAGIGGLVGRVLMFDGSVSYMNMKRSIDTLIEERSQTRFLFTASYRF